METVLDDVRGNLRKASVGYTGLAARGQQVTFKLRDASQIDAAKKR